MKATLPHLVLLFGALAIGAQAITPDALRLRLAAGERITLIDLRSQAAFAAGTLPDAMRMSAREAALKPLTGLVVFFDDGLVSGAAARAVAAVKEKNPDVQADVLVGGFAAWSALGGQTSERKGMHPARQRYVTYQDVAGDLADRAGEVVLLDVRSASKPQGAPAVAALGESAPASEPSIDLAAVFPQYAVTRTLPRTALPVSPKGEPARVAATMAGDEPLYVLIDAGDGTAERIARQLRAAGVARVVVLAGGEAIIRRKGVPGLLRRGSGAGLDEDRAGKPNFATLVEEGVQP